MGNVSKPKSIHSVLFKLLAKRDYAKQELHTKLKALEYPESEIESALNQAQQQNFINDHRFTENYIRQRSQRGYGPVRIQAELEAKGVDMDIILSLISTPLVWENLATTVREKRFGKMIPKDYAEKAKQMRFLQYRGFTVEQISRKFFHNLEEN